MAEPALHLPDDALIEPLCEDAGHYLRGGRLLEAGRSPWQAYEVWETPRFGRLFRLDGCFMSSERDEFHYHENLVHVPGLAHPGPRKALIIGGGDGGSAEELLKYGTMRRVVIVELDAQVVALARRYLHGVHHGVFDDPRVELRIGDGLDYVRAQRAAGGERYDLIVLDLTDPGGPAAALHTADFFAACRALLAAGGLLSLHLGTPVFQPGRVQAMVRSLRSVFACVRPYFLYIPLYGSLWGLASASDVIDPAALSADEVDRRLHARGIAGLQHLNGAVHCAQFALPNHLRSLLA